MHFSLKKFLSVWRTWQWFIFTCTCWTLLWKNYRQDCGDAVESWWLFFHFVLFCKTDFNWDQRTTISHESRVMWYEAASNRYLMLLPYFLWSPHIGWICLLLRRRILPQMSFLIPLCARYVSGLSRTGREICWRSVVDHFFGFSCQSLAWNGSQRCTWCCTERPVANALVGSRFPPLLSVACMEDTNLSVNTCQFLSELKWNSVIQTGNGGHLSSK